MASFTMRSTLAGVGLCIMAAGCAPGPPQAPPAEPAPPARQVFRTLDGQVFDTAAERDAYLHRHAAAERELYDLERTRQELLSGSLAAQQRARRAVRLRRQEQLVRDDARDLEATRRAERQAERTLLRIDRQEGLRPSTRVQPGPEPLADRLSRQRTATERLNADLARDRARRTPRGLARQGTAIWPGTD